MGTLTDRSLHLIDIENLAGPRHRQLRAVGVASRAYRASVRIGPSDQVIVGCNDVPDYRLHVGLQWAGRRIVAGRGSDGADHALLAAADVNWIHHQGFGRVFIGSGDRAFTPLAASLVAHGVPVTIVSRVDTMSRRLQDAATDVVALARISPVPPRRRSRLDYAWHGTDSRTVGTNLSEPTEHRGKSVEKTGKLQISG